MATLSITIPDAQTTRVVDAICIAHGYDPASGTTKIVFAKRWLIESVMAVVRAHESNLASESARMAAAAKVDTEVVIT